MVSDWDRSSPKAGGLRRGSSLRLLGLYHQDIWEEYIDGDMQGHRRMYRHGYPRVWACGLWSGSCGCGLIGLKPVYRVCIECF